MLVQLLSITYKTNTMKTLIFTILLLSLSNSSPSQSTWKTSYFFGGKIQKEPTWCVHACMEMTFGIPQCVSVLSWILYRDGVVNPMVNCCTAIITPDLIYPCVQNAGIPRYEITRFLTENYSVIKGRFTNLWEMLSQGSNVEVAFLSLKYSTTFHLAVLYRAREISDTYYEITYCDPAIGILTTVENPNPLEIIY